MGIFSFVKSAGEALANALGLDHPKAPEAIQQAVAKHGLGVDNVTTQVVGDKIIISGNAPTSEAAEKAILAAGNIKGVATVESNIAVATPEPESQFYAVQSGDNLSKIAKRFYGDANRYNEIFEANRPMLSHPDKIYPGQNLRIPNATAKSAAA